jgi:hypothetical protein
VIRAIFTFDDLTGKDWMASEDDEAAFFTMEASVRGSGQLHSSRTGVISALAQEGDQPLAGVDQGLQAFVRPSEGPLVVPQLVWCCQFRCLPFPSDLMRNAVRPPRFLATCSRERRRDARCQPSRALTPP